MLSVYCILEVKYCIPGVNVYMDMNFVDKKKLDWSFHTWQHFSALLIYQIAKEGKKRFQIILARTMCTFPISFCVCMCVSLSECVSECVRVQWYLAFLVQQGLSFVGKWSQNIEPFFFLFLLSFFFFNVASTVF